MTVPDTEKRLRERARVVAADKAVFLTAPELNALLDVVEAAQRWREVQTGIFDGQDVTKARTGLMVALSRLDRLEQS